MSFSIPLTRQCVEALAPGPSRPQASVIGERPKLCSDETTLPVLDPGRGRDKTGQPWAYALQSSAAQSPGPDYARQGIDLARSTLADWVGHAARHLRPLHQRLLDKLMQQQILCF